MVQEIGVIQHERVPLPVDGDPADDAGSGTDAAESVVAAEQEPQQRIPGGADQDIAGETRRHVYSVQQICHKCRQESRNTVK